jgi:protein-cysteine N-palmitoyltransferase HHAT
MAGSHYIFVKFLLYTDLNERQHRRPPRITGHSAWLYFFRFLGTLLTMEIILHFMYVVAIKDKKAWVGYSPAEISMVGFWNLMIVWLKVGKML